MRSGGVADGGQAGAGQEESCHACPLTCWLFSLPRGTWGGYRPSGESPGPPSALGLSVGGGGPGSATRSVERGRAWLA